IARLLNDGSVDATFDPDGGPDLVLQHGTGSPDATSIETIAVQSDGRIHIGGCFEAWNGGFVARAVARLTSEGRIDSSFTSTDEGWTLDLPGLRNPSGNL